MNANEARAISDKNKLKNSRIPYIQTKIVEATRNGRYLIVLHESLSSEDKEFLTMMGYNVSYDPDPHAGRFCSGPQTTIFW